MVAREIPRVKLHTELGSTSNHRVSSTLYEDYTPELRGARAFQVFTEMANDDATISSILYAITMLAREVDWRIEPYDDSPQAEKGAEFLTQQVEGLVHPLSDTIAEAVTGLVYGFSFHETVYRQDLSWERFSHRPADTLTKWELDAHRRPVAFVQSTRHGTVTIPNQKGLLFRLDTTTPSGTSLLRGAYRSWFFKKKATEYLMLGMSRNLAGMPRIDMPAEVLAAGPGNPFYDAMKDIVTRVKRDEQMGILFPSDVDAQGNRLYDFSLESPDADPHYDQAMAVVRMFATDITSTVLAQFIGLGRDTMGSRALAEPQQDMFRIALDAMLDGLEDAFNRQPVTELYRLHPNVGLPARLVHGDVKVTDIAAVTAGLLQTAQAGAEWFTGLPDDPLLAQLADMLGLDASTVTQ